LELREAHAAARDAVRAELDLESAFGAAFIMQWNLFEVRTEANSKEEYLLQPDLGRRLNESSRQELAVRCSQGNDVQVAIGDGLSVTAVAAQVPSLLPLLVEGAHARSWTVGNPFVIRHCRVGVLNEIGELLAPKVVVLLIGERPGLGTAESLSAYMAYRPAKTHTDANRNLISNIHSRGLSPQAAADRILNFVGQIMTQRMSGIGVKDELPTADQHPAILE
jgi:ethanolamine ammonia-lyase small subunit